MEKKLTGIEVEQKRFFQFASVILSRQESQKKSWNFKTTSDDVTNIKTSI